MFIVCRSKLNKDKDETKQEKTNSAYARGADDHGSGSGNQTRTLVLQKHVHSRRLPQSKQYLQNKKCVFI